MGGSNVPIWTWRFQGKMYSKCRHAVDLGKTWDAWAAEYKGKCAEVRTKKNYVTRYMREENA